MTLRRSIAPLIALTTMLSMVGLGISGIAQAQTPRMIVTTSPKPLIETGQSEVHAVIQVETSPRYANKDVTIDSTQLQGACPGGIRFEYIPDEATSPLGQDNVIAVPLDNDGNATVVVNGYDCAPGTDAIEADLDAPPYLTAIGALQVRAPVTTHAGVAGYPNWEVETGGNSAVYTVFYVETNPNFSEQPVEISSNELESRCGLGWVWEPGNGGSWVAGTGTGMNAWTTLDDDGNAAFVFEGSSCAAGSSTVVAEAGGHTFISTYTVEAPKPTI
jgi:hypothetical protein